MNMPVSTPHRMEYIQKLFMDVERAVEKLTQPDEIRRYLDAEEPLFRSVGYESASMVLGLRALMNDQSLTRWMEFRNQSGGQHSFHIDIGLGWAFAKTGLWSGAYAHAMDTSMQWMVYDGMGYYYGLFKGRTTIKQAIVPPELGEEASDGFNEGLGRRLWYMAKGDHEELLSLVMHFNETRHPALWQGIGIACGYVGGNSDAVIAAHMDASGVHQQYFEKGIMLATVSRIASNSMDTEFENTLRQVCNLEVDDLRNANLFQELDIFSLNESSSGLWFSERKIQVKKSMQEAKSVVY